MSYFFVSVAYLNLGQLLASLGRCEEAAAIFRQCSQLDSTGLKDQRQHEVTRTSALVHLGRLLADQGHYRRAVAVYLQAVDSMPAFYQPQVRCFLLDFLNLDLLLSNRKRHLGSRPLFSP